MSLNLRISEWGKHSGVPEWDPKSNDKYLFRRHTEKMINTWKEAEREKRLELNRYQTENVTSH